MATGNEVGFPMAHLVVQDVSGVRAGDVIFTRVEEGSDEELAIVEEGEGGFFEEVDFVGAGVDECDGAIAMRDGEKEGAVESKPEGVDFAVAVFEVFPGVVDEVEEAIDPEVLIGGEVEQGLPTPAEAGA
jgi:hypothetical protein